MADAIGVLGGTFDPIHLGHLRIAWEASEQLGLTEVRVIPAHQPPHRASPAATWAQRLHMVKLACQHVPGFVVDAREHTRQGPGWSVDTLESLREDIGPHRPLVFILGMDAFRQFSAWKAPTRILSLAHLWVAHRPGAAMPESDSAEAGLLRAHGTDDVRQLTTIPAGCITVQPSIALDISSTRIRALRHAGRDPRFLLPEAVRHYIAEAGLYPPPSPREHNTVQ